MAGSFIHGLTPSCPTLGGCLSAAPFLLFLYTASEALIGLGLLSLLVAVLVVSRRRRESRKRHLVVVAAAFLGTGALLHLAQIPAIWFDSFIVHGTLAAVTAVLSVAFASIVWRAVPEAGSAPSRRALFAELDATTSAQLAMEVQNAALSEKITRWTSELERAEQNTHRLSTLIDSSHDVILGADLDLIVWTANPAAEELFGISACELTGSSLESVQLDCEDLWRTVVERIKAGEPTVQLEAQCRRPSCDSVTIWFTVSPIRDSNGILEGLSVIARDVTERRQSRVHLAQSLAEKELLLKEVHHRVKNNLQVISSLLRLQSSYLATGPAKEMFRNSEDRVKCMALVHERLCRSESLSRVNFRGYVTELAQQLYASHSGHARGINLNLDLDDADLPIDRAVPCGLIMNELLSNSLRHAFTGRRQGVLEVMLRRMGDRVSLRVQDDGSGLPRGFDLETSTTLGFRVISTLGQQLRALICFSSAGGTVFEIEFEIEKQKVRGEGYGRDQHTSV